MNILMLGWELPPHNSGGLGVACYHLTKKLAFKGVDIDFVVPYTAKHNISFMKVHGALPTNPEKMMLPGAYDSKCVDCTDPADCEHMTQDHPMRAIQHRYTQHVIKMVKKKRPDAIHAHDWLTLEAGMRAKAIANRPLIAHVHATEFDRAGNNRGNSLVHEIEYQGLMMADKVIAVSNVTKNLIVREYGIPVDKVSVVHNSLDISEYEALEGDNTYPYLAEMKKRGYKVVVSVGRLTIQKGLSNMLEAARRAIDVEPKLLFLIAGSGELRDELIVRSAELGIANNIFFTGFVRGRAWRDAYDIGDMFVMPSVSEPFGLVALEAAGHQNAILMSKQSGAVEVLKNVLTFDFWDTLKFGDQLAAVARHPELRQNLQDNANLEFQNLSWDKAADAFYEMYRTLKPVEIYEPVGAHA